MLKSHLVTIIYLLNTHNNIIIYIKITLKSKTTVAHLYE